MKYFREVRKRCGSSAVSVCAAFAMQITFPLHLTETLHLLTNASLRRLEKTHRYVDSA